MEQRQRPEHAEELPWSDGGDGAGGGGDVRVM